MDATPDPAENLRARDGWPRPRDPAELRLPPRAVLLVAGVPGAGKTTLLRRVDTSGSVVLDPEVLRGAFEPLLGRLPYRLWRPLVHSRHYLRVLLELRGPAGLVVHEPGTRAWVRRLLVLAAGRAGRPAQLLLLEVRLEEALAGQRQRRRSL
ncbi:MAG TPA: AAA family ATPase, partial [Actinomycetota bacterium]|nr:AAA family ATPase [Actinomycetota bacterium]